MNTVKKYFRDSLKEFNNVTWPTQNQAIRISVIVLVFIVVSAAVLGLVDQLLSKGYQLLLNLNLS